MIDENLVAVVKKINKEKRLVTCVTNRCRNKDGKYYVDHDGDVILTADLEQAFIKSFFDDGASRGGGGEMHEIDGGADVVEWLVIDKAMREALEFGEGDEMGVIVMRVNDDALWQKVKDGTYREVSIEALGVREDI